MYRRAEIEAKFFQKSILSILWYEKAVVSGKESVASTASSLRDKRISVHFTEQLTAVKRLVETLLRKQIEAVIRFAWVLKKKMGTALVYR